MMTMLAQENNVMIKFLPFGNDTSDHNKAVILAEVMYTDMITELNLPTAAAATLNKLWKKHFTDSQIAESYHYETTALISRISTTETDIVEIMKTGEFSLCTDGSSDHIGKQYPLVVCIQITVGIHQGFLCGVELEGQGTGDKCLL